MQQSEKDLKHKQKMMRLKDAKDKIIKAKTNDKGLIIVHTGTGKGKSTAAFGMVIRMIAQGHKTAVVQYVKGAWDTGEKTLLQKHFSDKVAFFAMGEGFTWETQDRQKDIQAAENAWNMSKKFILDPQYKLILLDEINIVLRYGYISVETVVNFICENRPSNRHIILTGRNAHEKIIDIADLVTEMKLIKHPFRSGIKAQAGIEF